MNLIAGTFEGRKGPFEPLHDFFMATIELNGGTITLPAAPSRNVFLYVVRGDLTVGGTSVKAHHLIELNADGDTVTLAGDGFVLFGHAEPFGEPVFAHGPFVMNTREEIVQAIEDYNAGKFGVVPG